MAWPACERNWQERKKERCVASCDWNEEGCVVEGWRELAYFLTSYLTRVWWCLKTSMEATNSELHVMKCLRLHQDGLWTPTVSSQCSVDVLIMGLSCIFWKKKKEERRRRRKKLFFLMHFYFILFPGWPHMSPLANYFVVDIHCKMQMWSCLREAVCVCVSLDSCPADHTDFFVRGLWQTAVWHQVLDGSWNGSGSWGYVRGAHSLAVEDTNSSVTAAAWKHIKLWGHKCRMSSRITQSTAFVEYISPEASHWDIWAGFQN